MRLFIASALICIGAACAPGDAGWGDQNGHDAIGPARASIVGGAPTDGEPAVVVVKAFGGIGLCTGTLITPSVVLTAKHCIQASGAARPYPPSGIVVGFGSSADTSIDHPVRAVRTTPGAYTAIPGGGLEGAFYGIDLATVTLREPVTDVEPIRVGRARPVPGQIFTAVGFGQRPDGESGDKYVTTAQVAAVTGDILRTSRTICPGDSGGPAIIEGSPREVVGVASYGVADQCPGGADGYNLVEPLLGLIEASIIGAGECPYDAPGDRAETCNSVDDDCDGDIDEGCQALGAPCSLDSDCAFSALPAHLEAYDDRGGVDGGGAGDVVVFCGETGAGRVCTRRCDPTSPQTGCLEVPHAFGGGATATDGVYCAQGPGCDGLCAPGGPGTPGAPGSAAVGSACAADTECVSLRCQDPGDGRPRCLSPCVGDAGLCPVGEVCAALPGACGSCVGNAALAGPRGLGEACADGAECRSGLCDDPPDGAFCTATCAQDAECGGGFHCREARCAPGERSRTAETCISDGDCSFGERCESDYCVHPCTRDESCRDDFSCDGRVCVPLPGTALLGERCTGDDVCAHGACVEAGDGPRCVTPCGAEGGAGPCPPRLECRRIEEALLCVPASVGRDSGGSGGCSLTAASSSGGPGVLAGLAMVVLLAFGARRNRRR